MSTPKIDPPAGYPRKTWQEISGEDYYVPEQLRADYAATQGAELMDYTRVDPKRAYANATMNSIEQGIEAVPFTEWAHSVRMRNARTAFNSRRRQQAWEAEHLKPCPVCGDITDHNQWTRVAADLASDQPILPSTTGLRACRRCVPIVELLLRLGDPLPDGRARFDRARAFVETLTGRTAPAESGYQFAGLGRPSRDLEDGNHQ